ncbi:MAG TPA: hypothetical protein VGX03_02635 [Candidatus Binatia bacterium]|jgi:hypothetical protein|nr:hypothetical protein [Candidatus Binatia bacterium]
MRFVITGEWSKNRLLQLIIVLFVVYVALLWLTNALLYFHKMGLTYASVTEYYLGSEEKFLPPRSYQGMLEITHFHLFAMGILLLTLTHLMLFVPLRTALKPWFIVVPFSAALLDEGGGWLVRFAHPLFAYLKIAGFVTLEVSLAVLICVSLWAVVTGTQDTYRGGQPRVPKVEEGRELM